MNLTREKALQHFTGKNHLSDLSVEAWQDLANTFPYFVPAQFFLASRLKQQSQTAATAQIVKTGLYFTNPYWLQFQLHENPVAEDKGHRKVQATENIPASTVPVVTPATEIMSPSETIPEQEASFTDTEQPEEPIPAAEEEIMENKLSGILSEQLADFKKPVEADDKLDIETTHEQRLHTIDYFASQGIKIDLSRIPKDKLTTNLLKFTDWLKQMKNPNQPQTADLGTPSEMENAVMEIAKISNVSREVLTEAMAEVLVKQGQVDKAIQLLIKLSFINPEKSSYFAARIEQLKGII
jgi:hypothetical protein